MDAELERLFVSVGADISGAVLGLNQLEARLGGFEGKVKQTSGIWSGFTGGLAKIGLAINGVQGIIAVGQRALSTFEELGLTAARYDASLGRLRKAIENTGVAMNDKMNAKLDENLQKMQDAAGFSKNEIIPAYSNLVAITGSYQEATDRMALAQDFARGSGLELATASRLLGKVTDETTTVLARYGIRVEKGAKATELLEKVQAKFGGQSKVFMASVLGQWEKLQLRIEDNKRAMSERLQPAFLTFIGIANKALDFTGALFASWEKPIGNALSLIGNFAGALGEIFDVASAAPTSILPDVDEFKKRGMGPDNENLKKAAQGGELTKILGPDSAKGFMHNVAKLREAVRALWDFIVHAFQEGQRRLQPVLDEVGKQLGNLKTKFEELPGPIKEFAGTATAAAAPMVVFGGLGLATADTLINIGTNALAAGGMIARLGLRFIWLSILMGAIILITRLLSDHWDDVTEMFKLFGAVSETIFARLGNAIISGLLAPINLVIIAINLLIGGFNAITGKKINLIPILEFKLPGQDAFANTLADSLAKGEARRRAGGNVGFTSSDYANAAATLGSIKDVVINQTVNIDGSADAATVNAFKGAAVDGLTELIRQQTRRVPV